MKIIFNGIHMMPLSQTYSNRDHPQVHLEVLQAKGRPLVYIDVPSALVAAPVVASSGLLKALGNTWGILEECN